MLTPIQEFPQPRWSVVLPEGTAGIYRLETSLVFLTGLEIDLPATREGDPGTLAAKALTDSTSVPFRLPEAANTPGERFYGIETEVHGSSVLPNSVVEVDPAWLLSQSGGDVSSFGWRLASVQAEIRDFGVGVAQLEWVAETNLTTTTDELEACIAGLDSRTSEVMADVVDQITREFIRILEHHPARLKAGHVLDRARSKYLPRPGRILWVSSHCRATSDAPLVMAESLARLLCPNAPTVLEHRDHVYAPGVSRSVTCSRSGWEHDAGTLTTSLLRQDAWWALYWALDRMLLWLQLDLIAETRTSIRALADRSQTIAAAYERISLYQSRIDTTLTSGGSRELAVWECLATAWDLDFRMACVDRKLAQIQRNYDNALTSIQSVRTARVSVMIFLFTAFSVVASAVAVVQYAANEQNGSLAFRIALLLALTATTLGAVAGSFAARTRSLRSGLEGRPGRGGGSRR